MLKRKSVESLPAEYTPESTSLQYFVFPSRSPSESCKPHPLCTDDKAASFYLRAFAQHRPVRFKSYRFLQTFPIHHQFRPAFLRWILVSACCILPSKTKPVARKFSPSYASWRAIGTPENFHLKLRYLLATVLRDSWTIKPRTNCTWVAGNSFLSSVGKNRLTSLKHSKSNKSVTIDWDQLK
jgi:hypothetical protein